MAVVVLVETEVSKENVSRLARSKGYSVEIEKLADEYRLVLQLGCGCTRGLTAGSSDSELVPGQLGLTVEMEREERVRLTQTVSGAG